MSLNEVVTVQLGHYANHVGAHLWNIQESSFVYDPSQVTGKKEICHDVLYREGENRRREVTFTPRLVAFDLKGSLKTLKQEGQLYDTCTDGEEIQWPGDITMHKEESETGLSYLQSLYMATDKDDDQSSKDDSDDEDDSGKKQLKKKKVEVSKLDADKIKHQLSSFDDTVSVWSDYLGTHFHPKSVHIVEEFRYKDELRPFDLYPLGNEVLGNYETTCEWEDRMHYFTEECDNLQGFHVLMDTHDGFGGLSDGLLKYLEDEFPGKGVLTFGFTPASIPDDAAIARANRIINSALAYDSASTHSSLFVPTSIAQGLWRVLEGPVQFSNLSYKTIPYHTSAILASAIETMSLPYRLDSNAINLRDITHSFNAQGRKLAALNCNLPLGLYQDESLIDFFTMYCQKASSYPWRSLTPHMTGESMAYMQSVVMRGAEDSQVKTDTDPRKLPSHLIGSKSVKEVVDSFIGEKCSGNPFAVTCLNSPMKTAMPYPHIFNERVNRYGLLTPTSRPESIQVESVPLITSLQSTQELEGVVEQLSMAAEKLNIKKHHRYLSCGLEEDDYIEAVDRLKSLAATYTPHTEAL